MNHYGEPIAIRDNFEEAAAAMIERARYLAGQPVSMAERRLSIQPVLDPQKETA